MSRRKKRCIRDPHSPQSTRREYLWIVLGILVVGVALYAPALSGPFVFDDLVQPYSRTAPHLQSIGEWISIVRPLLMISFWLNYRIAGVQPELYHLFNLLCHLLNSLLIFFITGRLLKLERTQPAEGAAGRDRLLSLFAALLFLVHPLQTESVSYIVSRSETLTACFLLSAYLIFLNRAGLNRAGAHMRWGASLAIAGLFVLAGATKEIAVALVPLIILTDWFFSLGGVRRNWRLYGLLGAAAIGASAIAFLVLKDAQSAGFAMQGVNWYEYLFTQWRSLWVYLRLFLLPVGQTIDHDFPLSRSLFAHGSWAALLALVAGLAAVVLRRRSWGLISFGILAWITLLLPTSSVVPLHDTLVEHRMYLPFLGLVAASVGFAARLRVSSRALILGGVVLLGALSAATYYRNTLWGEPVLLWREAIRESPQKARPYGNLASVYLARGNCREASREFANAPMGWQPDYYAMVTWGMAESCLANYDRAVSLFQQAFALVGGTWEHTPSAAKAKIEMLIGVALLKKGDESGSIAALDRAVKLDPALDMAYAYRGSWKQHNSNYVEAIEDYQRALELNPRNPMARQALASLLQRPGAATPPIAGSN